VSSISGGTFATNVNSGTDPLFVDAAHHDYHLQSTSPAIDMGTVIPGITDGYLGTAPDAGAYEFGGAGFTPGCSMAGCAPAIVDDATIGTGVDQFNYGGSGWVHTTGVDFGSPAPRPGFCPSFTGPTYPYQGTFSSSATSGDTVIVSFSGTGVGLHVETGPENGVMGVSLDGGPEELVDTYGPTSYCPHAAGDQLRWQAAGLTPGSHTLQVRVTGTKHPYSTSNVVRLDRIEVYP
jgi:hypothetical protein